MKRTLAFLLCAVLLLSCLPIVSAGAKDVGVETKFRMLLEDMELVQNVHRSDRYFFEQIGQYPAKDPEWVLIRGGLYDLSANGDIQYQYAAFGNKFLRANTNSSPFSLGYGVFDVKTNVFYDLVDAWDMNLNHLREVWDELAPAVPYDAKDKSSENGMYVIGDADVDGEVTILDATRIQRCLAELDENPWESFTATGADFVRGTVVAGATDYDRDGDTTVMDATRIQRNIADLPNNIDAKIISDDANLKFIDDDTITKAQLLTDRTALSDFSKQYTDSAPDKKYNDAYFKDHTLIGVYLRLSDLGYGVYLDSAKIDVNGTLTLDFTAKNEEAIEPHNEARFILVEISSAYIDDIKDVDANINVVHPEDPTQVIANVVQKDDAIARPSKADATAQGYRFVDSERVFKGNSGDRYPYPVFDPIIANNKYNRTYDVGYFALIETPAQLSYLFPEMDTSAYDERFFKQYALAALVYNTEWTVQHNLYLSHLAVKDNTLYGQMEILDPLLTLDAHTIYYDIHKVKRSDVSGVNDTALWENENYTKHYLYDSYRSDQNLPHRAEYQPTDNYRSVKTYDTHNGDTIWEDNKSDFRVDTRHTKILGLVYNPEQWNYFLKDHPLPQRPMASYNGGPPVPAVETDSENTFEEYAYLILDYTGLSVGAEITDVYTNGTELDVFVRENDYVGGTEAQTYHSIGIVKLSKGDIQNVKSIHMWLDDVFWDDSAAIVFDDRAKDTAGSTSAGQLITDRSGLTAFANKNMSSSAKRNLEGKFSDAYFKYHNLIGAYVPLGSGSDTLSLKSVEWLNDSTLALNLLITNEYGVGNTAMNYRAVLVSLSKNNYSASLIDRITVNLTFEFEDFSDYPDLPEVHPITDDRKISEPTGNAISFTGLPTTELVYLLTYPFAENEYVSEHFSQPYTVAIIRTYAQYQSFFSTRYFKKYNGEPIVKDENDQQITESFFEDNAMIVGVGKFDLGKAWLSFDKIYTKASGENVLEVCFNRYDMGDLTDEPYAAPITGYCFAAAKVPKNSVGSLYDIRMLPEVKKIPVDLEVYIGTGTDTAGATAIAGGGSDPFEYCYTISGGNFVTSYQGMLDKGFRSVKESDPDYELLKPGSFAMTTGYIDKDMLDLPLNCLGYDEEYTLTVRARRTTDGISSAPVTKTFSGIKEKALVETMTGLNERYKESFIINNAFDYRYITTTEMESVDGNKNTLEGTGLLHLAQDPVYGYFLLMKDKASFDQHFAEVKTKFTYDSTFFKDYALIAVVGQGSCTDAVATVNSLAVRDEGMMLYSDARIDYPHPDLAAGATMPLVWTLHRVKKSDVQNVTGIGFWNPDSMIREIVPERVTMNYLVNHSGYDYRPLASTVLDIEPKNSQARYDLGYNSLGLNESGLTGGYIIMIKDTRTLNRYFPSKHFKTEAYTDAYFNDNAIIAMVSHGDEDTVRADLNALGILGDRLYVDAGVSYHPYFSADGMQAETPSEPKVWAFRQVKKSDISGVKTFCFWNSEATVEPIYFRNDIPDPTSENIRDIKTTEITMSAPSESDFLWKSLGSSEKGYTLILKSRAALEYYLPGFDTEKKYNDAFFKDSAIIAAVLMGDDYTSTAHFGKIGLINNTLFVNAYYTNNEPVIDGTPVAQPTTPTIWTFAKVSKEDIKSVGDIQFWNAK